MTIPSKFQRFVTSQITFLKYLKTNFFKPFSLDAMVEEQEKEYKIKSDALKKQSIDSIAKLKLIADLQFAQHQINDRTKELDYLYQRREANRKKQLQAMNELLSSIELDEDGYIIKKNTSTTSTSTSSKQISIENILSQSIKQEQNLKQQQNNNNNQNLSINDLDSMFENENNNNNTNNNNNNLKPANQKEYINVNEFDFDSYFKQPTKFTEEQYLKEKQERKLKQQQQRQQQQQQEK